MAMFKWKKYKYPLCNNDLSDNAIAEAYFTNKCLHCQSKLFIDAPVALRETFTASWIAVGTIGLYAIFMGWIDANYYDLNSLLKSLKQLHIALTYILGYSLVFLLCAPGFGLALLTTRVYRNFILNENLKYLNKKGKVSISKKKPNY